MAEVVLGIETSCDETSAAVLVKGELASLSILSQDVHQIFGGVVPEIKGGDVRPCDKSALAIGCYGEGR